MGEYRLFLKLKTFPYHLNDNAVVENQGTNYPEECGLWFVSKERILEGFKQGIERVTSHFG